MFDIVLFFLTPQVGFEPTTNRLTADRSTTELLRIANSYINSKRLYLASVLAKKL
jgi:hypothetical protein